ncbi:hypothetical protein EBU24_02460 [bacterium]|nr:hypothetical protein [bacterium]
MKKIGLIFGFLAIISLVFIFTEQEKALSVLTGTPLLCAQDEPLCKNICSIDRSLSFDIYKKKSPTEKRAELIKSAKTLEELAQSRFKKNKAQDTKINILIIGNNGGGGHKSAGDAITKILKELPGQTNLFNIVYLEPFASSLTNGWNKALQQEDGKTLAWLCGNKRLFDFGLGCFPFNNILRSTLKDAMKKPDVILQVQPLGTARFKRIAKDRGAQHRVVPTDLRVDQFVDGIKNIPAGNLRFSVDIMGDMPDLIEVLEKKSIKSYEAFVGARGTLTSRIVRYAHIIAQHADTLAPKNKKVHLFLAQADTFIDTLKEELTLVCKTTKNPPLVIHALGKVSAQEVGMFMHAGVTLTKAGGSTVAELLTLKAPAVFDMSISQYIVWEKYAADLFVKNKWGIQLTNPEDDKEVADALKKAFELRKNCCASMPTNQFHLDWPKAFMDDLSLFLCDQLAR